MKKPKTLPRHKIGTLVEVTWYDAYGDTGWKTTDFWDDEPCEVKTVGYVVKNHKKHLLLAQNRQRYSGNKEYGQPMGIPWGIIQRVRKCH